MKADITDKKLVCTAANVKIEEAEKLEAIDAGECAAGVVVTQASGVATFSPPVVTAASPAISVVNSQENKADTTFTITGVRFDGAAKVTACGKPCKLSKVKADITDEKLVCTAEGVKKEDADTLEAKDAGKCAAGVVVDQASGKAKFPK